MHTSCYYSTKVPFCVTSLPKLSLDIITFIVLVSFLTSVITQLLILSIRMCRIKQRKKIWWEGIIVSR